MMLLYVGLGSALGGMLRLVVGTWIQQRAGLTFPAGTFLINVTGSLALGFLLRYALGSPSITPEIRALLTTGVCGGFTTFSTFSYDAMALLEEGQYRQATLYVVGTVVLSLAAAWAGIALAQHTLSLRHRA